MLGLSSLGENPDDPIARILNPICHQEKTPPTQGERANFREFSSGLRRFLALLRIGRQQHKSVALLSCSDPSLTGRISRLGTFSPCRRTYDKYCNDENYFAFTSLRCKFTPLTLFSFHRHSMPAIPIIFGFAKAAHTVTSRTESVSECLSLRSTTLTGLVVQLQPRSFRAWYSPQVAAGRRRGAISCEGGFIVLRKIVSSERSRRNIQWES